MAWLSDVPAFNVRVVVQETGLKPDTLRVWERRYGLPRPVRTPGGHRLYSERDVAALKWLLARRDEGLSISRAVALWRRLQAEGGDPLQPDAPRPVVAGLGWSPVSGVAIDQLRHQWLEAGLAFDELRAEQVLTQALARFPPEVVVLELMLRVLAQIGDLWYRGEATVQQEHFCSSLTIRRLDALVLGSPAPTRPFRILIACPPHEEHTVSSLVLTFLLRRRGLDVVYLGANLPQEHLDATLESVHPHLVVLSAQRLHTAASLLEVALLLQNRQLPLAFGGLVFNRLPSLRLRIPGYFLGERMEEAVWQLEEILANPHSRVQSEPARDDCRPALEHYQERRLLIEADLWHHLPTMRVSRSVMAAAVAQLGQDIVAALTLGDVALLGDASDCATGFPVSRQFPVHEIGRFLSCYCQAVQAHLDAPGWPIVAWFERIGACIQSDSWQAMED